MKINPSEYDFTFSRSSGPGGQNVNKVNSRVTLTWDIQSSESINSAQKKRFIEKYPQKQNKQGLVQIHSQRFRDQGRNIADCIEKLHELLESVYLPPKKRIPTRPKKSAVQKRLNSKKRLSEKKGQRKKIY